MHNVSIEVHKNEIVSIIGPNGAGKSTILKAILGTLDIKSGEIFLLEKKITGIKPSDIVRKGVDMFLKQIMFLLVYQCMKILKWVLGPLKLI